MDLSKVYDDKFYQNAASLENGSSYMSAKQVVGYINELFSPKSVIDVGCGIGTWLKAYSELGSGIKIAGIDGNSSQSMHLIDAQNYMQVDFTQDCQKIFSDCVDTFLAPQRSGGGGGVTRDSEISESKLQNSSNTSDKNKNFSQKFDIAQSLEVAEHLYEQYAQNFVELLTKLSDVVVFSAAIPYQGGTHHVNEREPKYWADIFAKYNFVCFDIFRQKFWDDERISVWYRQNMFVFVNKKNQNALEILKDNGFESTSNPTFLIHPQSFLLKGRAYEQLDKLYKFTIEFWLKKFLVGILRKLGLLDGVKKILNWQ